MLVDAMRFLRDQADAARRVEFTKCDDLPNTVVVKKPDGDYHLLPVPPELVEVVMHNYDSFVRFVGLDGQNEWPKAEVYVRPHAVIALLDRNDRRETAALPLVITDQAEFIELVKVKGFRGSPKQIIHTMVRNMTTSAEAGAVIESLRKIDFKLLATGRSEIAHGRETLGKSVEAAVQQADKVPQVFEATAPLWRGMDYHITVRIGVYLDAEAQEVELFVYPDDLPRAVDKCVRMLVEDLATALDHKVNVFAGNP